MGAPVPVNGFRHVCSNTVSVLVTRTDIVQCRGMSLGGSKLSQPQRFNAFAIAVLCLLPSCPSSRCVTADLRLQRDAVEGGAGEIFACVGQ